MPANNRRAMTQESVRSFIMDNPYAYLTVYKADRTVCEGTVRSLSRIVDLSGFRFKSFFTMCTEDGGLEIEAEIGRASCRERV